MMQAIQVPVPGGDFEFVQREIPEPLDNEVLIRVESSGSAASKSAVAVRANLQMAQV